MSDKQTTSTPAPRLNCVWCKQDKACRFHRAKSLEDLQTIVTKEVVHHREQGLYHVIAASLAGIDMLALIDPSYIAEFSLEPIQQRIAQYGEEISAQDCRKLAALFLAMAQIIEAQERVSELMEELHDEDQDID